VIVIITHRACICQHKLRGTNSLTGLVECMNGLHNTHIIWQRSRCRPATLVEGMDESQDMHLLAERHILTGLKEGGWLQGEIEEMLEQRVAALFMPHGMRHIRLLHCGHALQWYMMLVTTTL